MTHTTLTSLSEGMEKTNGTKQTSSQDSQEGKWNPEWTKDLYWSSLDNDDDFDGFLYITNTKDGTQTRIDLRPLLHQSRTELMRKVVEVVDNAHNHIPATEESMAVQSTSRSALIKLAGEEGIEL